MASNVSTRDRLVDSARYLFRDRGYAGTSMAELLNHSVVNSGRFYHFFDSKEALFRKVLRGYLVMLRPMVVAPAFESTDDPIARIFPILAGYRVRIMATGNRYDCPLGRVALEIDPENRPAHDLIAENFAGWIGVIRQCLDEARDPLPDDCDLHSLATYVLAVMKGGVMLSRSYGVIDPFDRTIAVLQDHFERLTSSKRSNAKTRRAT